jgi:hypothetical protein
MKLGGNFRGKRKIESLSEMDMVEHESQLLWGPFVAILELIFPSPRQAFKFGLIWVKCGQKYNYIFFLFLKQRIRITLSFWF